MSNITIAIPPFPSQDLAKLVLGYLAEEQLMTAYDEFLQASPYLDALRNEYDRIFMTSLKNILAEYRALKIYVETCKPVILRRKLLQCSNLLEIVKYLVCNVDVNKLHLSEGNIEKAGYNRYSSVKSNVLCDLCISLKLATCACRNSQSTSQIEASSLERSVETTSLADLPGNTAYSDKIVKEPEPEYEISHSITSSNQKKDGRSVKTIQCSDNLSSTSEASITENVISSAPEKISPTNPSLLIRGKDSELRPRVQVLNDNLNLISHNRNDNLNSQLDASDAKNANKVGDTNVSQAIDAECGGSNNKVIVPDSSTSETNILLTPTAENDDFSKSRSINKKASRHSSLIIRVSKENTHLGSQPIYSQNLPKLTLKESLVKSTNSEDSAISPKITILSDVKVDKEMPPLLKNSTSRSLVPMQTLYINGTPAYNTPRVEQTFTKDEIMAMPTIILVPASDKTKKTVPTVTQNNMFDSSASVSCASSQRLEPLVIDVSPNSATSDQINDPMNVNSIQENAKDCGLIKTVDITSLSHASLPKDNTHAGLKTSTPHILPPARKSSSTPRRSSHVRVLDFTTPRRILHETITEHHVKQGLPNADEVTISKETCPPPINENNIEEVVPECSKNSSNIDTITVNRSTHEEGTKENKTSIKLYNWDAELRALAFIGTGNIDKSEPTRKSKSSKSKKNQANKTPTDKTKSNSKSEATKSAKKNDKKKGVSKAQSTKSKKKTIEVTEKNPDDVQQKPSVSVVKPTINIISRKKWSEPGDSDRNVNKSSNADEKIETPEIERISLQNEIGAKLNISDFLETPYKQALYDIQMETPKFLGPDLPGDPLSDVKIMSIPTPRFLNTPKLPQNTPSSYSSRPTDYSSGGSYYKPDDQDYILANEIMEEALSESAESLKTNKVVEPERAAKVCEGKSRPVRQCTKNVSYNYGTPSHSKIKDVEDKGDKTSTCSETSISKPDRKIEKPKMSDKDNVVEKKREQKKKFKKIKSPKKKEVPKTFLKIKPRRTTPVKEILGKGKKKSHDFSPVSVKSQSKKVVGGKENNDCLSHIAVAPVLTKSRRKSSTPRKLNCTKKINVENLKTNSLVHKKQTSHVNIFDTVETDTEQLPLRWSDESSQDSGTKNRAEKRESVNESDDISKIKEYIETTATKEVRVSNEGEGTLQVDLIKRGFDVETARMIERDLLETPNYHSSNHKTSVQNISPCIPSMSHEQKNESLSKKSDNSAESDCSTNNNLQIVQEDDSDGLDFSVYECNEESINYFVCKYDEALFVPTKQVKLKDTFSMEICVEDDVEIRLRATPFNTVFEHDCKHENIEYCDKEVIETLASPVHYNAEYTPRKAQCYQIFDSTLASLDTPLKPNSPKAQEFETVTEIVLEVEKLETDVKQRPESKKRKRVTSGIVGETSCKKVKSDTSYLLNSAGIQNIDIESVLSKLHGP